MSKKRLRSASAADKFLQTAIVEPMEEVSTTKDDETKNKDYLQQEILTKDNTVTEKNELSKSNSKIGQPKKYDEPTKHISFSLPVSVIENLKIIAGLKKTNQTQLILSLINAEIEKETDKIEVYKKLLI